MIEDEGGGDGGMALCVGMGRKVHGVGYGGLALALHGMARHDEKDVACIDGLFPASIAFS